MYFKRDTDVPFQWILMFERLWKHGSIGSTWTIKDLRRTTGFGSKGRSESPGSPLSSYTWGNRRFSAKGSFSAFCLFPPSKMTFPLLALHIIHLSPVRSAALMWPWKAPLLHCPPRALALTPAQGEKESGAEGWPPQGRRQSQQETDLDMLELLHNYLRFSFLPSPNSSWHRPFQVVSSGGKRTPRPVVPQSGAKPKRLHTVPVPPPWSIWCLR